MGGYPRSMFRVGGYPPWQVPCSGPTPPSPGHIHPSVILIPWTYPSPLPLGYSRPPLDILIPSPSGYSPIHHGHNYSPPLGYPAPACGHHWRQYSPPPPNRMTNTCEIASCTIFPIFIITIKPTCITSHTLSTILTFENLSLCFCIWLMQASLSFI